MTSLITTCKICESEIVAEKLIEHSPQCKEVTELKDSLFSLTNKMQQYSDKASILKNSLETYATKQKKVQKKLSRSNSGIVDSGSSNSMGESLSGNSSLKSDHTEVELHASEEDIKTNEKNIKKELTTILEFYEPTKKMTNEDYDKFISEVKNSVFALKKVIAYANKTSAWSYENDLDFDAKNELEVVYANVIGSSISKFLRYFIDDLNTYLELKKQFVKKLEKLVGISNENVYKNLKNCFQASKSRSFKCRRGPHLKAPQTVSNRFKEDIVFGFQESPNNNSKKTLPFRPFVEFGTPISNQENLTSHSPSLRIGQGLLQANTNHVSQKSLFSGTRVNQKGLDILREKLGALAQNHNSENKMIDSNGETSHQVKIMQYKEKVRNKKNRSTATNLKELMPNQCSPLKEEKVGLGAAYKINEKISKFDISNKPEDSKQSGRKSRGIANRKRTSSMDLYRTLHKEEEEAESSRFPSLLIKNSNTGEGRSPDKESPDKYYRFSKKKSQEDSPNLWESPGMRGYHSDNYSHKNKQSIFTSEISQVSIEDFEPIKFIGKGAYGTVWLVKKKATGDKYAMKIVNWADRGAQNRLSALKLERDIYGMLKGDYVVKAVWTFHHENFICFVTEYMIGGDFNKLLDQLGRLEEDQARFYFAELVLAVESLHNLGIVHRDLKPDNILMDAKGHIKLTDFGLSQAGLNKFRENTGPNNGGKSNATSPINLQKKSSVFEIWNKEIDGELNIHHIEFKTNKIAEVIHGMQVSEANENLRIERKPSKCKKSIQKEVPCKKKSMVGTPDYMAPEVIDLDKVIEPYYEKCIDWWSMGVILYQLLVGVTPFGGNTVEEVFENIKNLSLEWPSIGYDEDSITPEAVDLIKKLLEPDPKKRLGANGTQEIKNHVFFKALNWEKIREREGPIIPCAKEEEASPRHAISLCELDEEAPEAVFPRSNTGLLQTPSAKRQLKQINLEAFQLKRLDVLEALNQENYKKLQTKESIVLNKTEMMEEGDKGDKGS